MNQGFFLKNWLSFDRICQTYMRHFLVFTKADEAEKGSDLRLTVVDPVSGPGNRKRKWAVKKSDVGAVQNGQYAE